MRPKDTLEPKKRNGVVYKIPRERGKVYIGKMGRSMPERIKEHDRATLKQSTSSPDEDKQYCSLNGAINVQSDSIVRQTSKVHILM